MLALLHIKKDVQILLFKYAAQLQEMFETDVSVIYKKGRKLLKNIPEHQMEDALAQDVYLHVKSHESPYFDRVRKI